jgi:hypothetical protein|tara:strand:- start:1277 stop:1666 length:390 start_codon:yes stop_codon:yes gene_type:complete
MILTLEKYTLEDTFGTSSELVRSMSEFFTEELNIGHYDAMINVILHDEIKVEGLDGYCEWDPKDKLIEINLAMKGPEWGVTLAHEFVHAKQNLEYGIASNNIVLSEQEAYDMEFLLYYRWKKEYYSGTI